ncbi:MAG: hypothetical protein GY719_16920 [bacterium]|nr:hypothetical protein [bacterium]
MPHTVNGIGTSYWGKTNVELRRDVCEHCQAAGDLISYDTTKYFVLVFLPLLPLGKLRVLDECPSCRRHRVMKLGQWQELRQQSVAEAIAAYQANPTDREAAQNAAHTCAAFQDREAFVGLAGRILETFGNDAEMVADIGSTLGYFGHIQEAEVAYRKSLAVRDDAEIRQALGVVLLRQERPDDAWPMLEHLFQSETVDEAGTLFLLVEAYQAQGKHTEALQILDALAQKFPDLAGDKSFAKTRKRSQKHQRSGKKIPSALLAPTKVARESALTRRLATLVWPLLLLLLVVPVAWFAISSAREHEVYLANGLTQRYAVRIGEETHHLPPGRAVPVKVAQGVDHVAQVVGDGPALEPVSFRVDLSFWKSLSGDHTFVVNPDRLAVLIWNQVQYAEIPDPNREDPYEVRTGKAFYTYEGVDYEFHDFPDEVTLPSSRNSVLRENVDLLADRPPMETYFMLIGEADEQTALAYLKRAVDLLPATDDSLHLLSGVAPPEEFAALAAPRLAARPVKVEWHRAYQNALERDGRHQALSEEYAGLLDAEPESSRLLYLASRIDADPDRAEARLRRAIELDPENAWAFGSLAYHALSSGRASDAQPLIQEARRLMPDSRSFKAIGDDVARATGRYQPLLEENLAQQQDRPLDGNLVATEILLRSAAGQGEQAAARVAPFLEQLESADPAEGWGEPAEWRPYLEAVVSHGRGDLAGYGERIGQVTGHAFQAALISGALSEAGQALTDSGQPTAENHLLMFLAASRAGDKALAGQHLTAAIEVLSQGLQEQRVFADALAGEAPPELDLLRLPLDPATKSIGLAAMAVRDPARAASYRRRARQLNFRLGFPRLYLEKMLSG